MHKHAPAAFKPTFGNMLLGFAFAPLLGSLLFAGVMFPFLLLMGEGFAQAVLHKPGMGALTIGLTTLASARYAYQSLFMLVPLSMAMRAGGYTARYHWMGAGLLLSHLMAYGDIYGAETQPFGMVFAVVGVSVAGIACGFMFWAITCYLPMKDAQAEATAQPPV